jgi:hypothetical protein
LAGNIETNRKSGGKLRAQMMQVQAATEVLRLYFAINRIRPPAKPEL